MNKKWYNLDEVCNKFRIKDSGLEFTISQAADILGRTTGEIRRLIKTKLLTTHKTGGRYVIKKTDFDKYQKTLSPDDNIELIESLQIRFMSHHSGRHFHENRHSARTGKQFSRSVDSAHQ